MSDYCMIMRFVDESESFTKGFECGLMWAMFDAHKKFEQYLFHTENKEQVDIMCRRFHYRYSVEEINETWSILNAELHPVLAN